MKNQKGFIQIPLLIAIISGVLILGGAGYFGVKQYQKYKNEANIQQKVLEPAQAEIEKLKKNTSPFSQKESSALRIERCKTEAEIKAKEAASDFYKTLLGGITPNLPIDELRNTLELLNTIVKNEKEKDYNRFYLNCLDR